MKKIKRINNLKNLNLASCIANAYHQSVLLNHDVDSVEAMCERGRNNHGNNVLNAYQYLAYSVDRNVMKLDKVSREFVIAFLFNEKEKQLRDRYSKSTFYRLRNQAVGEFIRGMGISA